MGYVQHLSPLGNSALPFWREPGGGEGMLKGQNCPRSLKSLQILSDFQPHICMREVADQPDQPRESVMKGSFIEGKQWSQFPLIEFLGKKYILKWNGQIFCHRGFLQALNFHTEDLLLPRTALRAIKSFHSQWLTLLRAFSELSKYSGRCFTYIIPIILTKLWEKVFLIPILEVGKLMCRSIRHTAQGHPTINGELWGSDR